MLKKLQQISLYQSLKFDTITRIPDADTKISNAFFIKFSNILNPIISGGSFSRSKPEQMSILRHKLQKELLPLDIDIYFIDNCAILWIERTLKDERKEKLKQIEND
jgi:hypothetical protein